MRTGVSARTGLAESGSVRVDPVIAITTARQWRRDSAELPSPLGERSCSYRCRSGAAALAVSPSLSCNHATAAVPVSVRG